MGIVFDLDDTILPEAEYVRSGMNAVAAYCVSCLTPRRLYSLLSKACTEGLPPLPAVEIDTPAASSESADVIGLRALCAQAISRFLLEEFERDVRGNSFDRLLAAFPELKACPAPLGIFPPASLTFTPPSTGEAGGDSLERRRKGEGAQLVVADGVNVINLVQVYREHVPKIALSPLWRCLLQRLCASGRRVGIISDGPLVTQAAKVKALGLAEFCDPILLTDRWGREFWKPSARAYREIELLWGEPGGELTYVGDNPAKDFLAANELGWRTVRLRFPGQLHYAAAAAGAAAAAQIVCGSLVELERVLNSVGPSSAPL